MSCKADGSHQGEHTTLKTMALQIAWREPDVFCNARGRGGRYCHNIAGKGTKHLGEGRCKFHGGNSPKYLKRLENERVLMATPKGLSERAIAYLEDTELYGLGREIARLRAASETLNMIIIDGETRDIESIEALTKLAAVIGRLVAQQEEINRSRRYVVPVSKVNRWSLGIRDILERYIEDPELLAAIGREIQKLASQDEDYPA